MNGCTCMYLVDVLHEEVVGCEGEVSVEKLAVLVVKRVPVINIQLTKCITLEMNDKVHGSIYRL